MNQTVLIYTGKEGFAMLTYKSNGDNVISGVVATSLYALRGATVIITGASGGFGSELTKQLIKRFSCRVIGIGRTKEKMEALANSLGKDKKYFKYYLFDVSDKKKWQSFAKTLEKKGIVPDMLINNAGIMPPLEKFENETSDTVIEVMNTNFMAPVYSCEALLPILKRSERPAIVNVSSAAAYSPVIGTAAYSASKGALKNFTQALCEELDGRVYVGLVCPGFSKTELFRNMKFDEKEKELLDGIGTDKADIAKAIIEGIILKRKLILAGKDAKLMTALSNAAPAHANSLYTKVLKSAKLDMFGDIE